MALLSIALEKLEFCTQVIGEQLDQAKWIMDQMDREG